MSAIYLNLELKVLNAIVLRRVRFRCSGVFRWCYVGIPGCSAGVPEYSVVSPLFRGVPLFRRCSIVPCSGVPGFIVCLMRGIYRKLSLMMKEKPFY